MCMLHNLKRGRPMLNGNHPEVTHGLKKSEQQIRQERMFLQWVFDARYRQREIDRMHRDLLRRMEREVARQNKKSSSSRIKTVRQNLRKEFGNRMKRVLQSIRNQFAKQFQTIRNRN